MVEMEIDSDEVILFKNQSTDQIWKVKRMDIEERAKDSLFARMIDPNQPMNTRIPATIGTETGQQSSDQFLIEYDSKYFHQIFDYLTGKANPFDYFHAGRVQEFEEMMVDFGYFLLPVPDKLWLSHYLIFKRNCGVVEERQRLEEEFTAMLGFMVHECLVKLQEMDQQQLAEIKDSATIKKHRHIHDRFTGLIQKWETMVFRLAIVNRDYFPPPRRCDPQRYIPPPPSPYDDEYSDHGQSFASGDSPSFPNPTHSLYIDSPAQSPVHHDCDCSRHSQMDILEDQEIERNHEKKNKDLKRWQWTRGTRPGFVLCLGSVPDANLVSSHVDAESDGKTFPDVIKIMNLFRDPHVASQFLTRADYEFRHADDNSHIRFSHVISDV